MVWLLLLIKVSVLFLVAFGAAALLCRSAASVRHLMWSSLFASVVALPLLSATLPRIEIPVPAAWQIAIPSTGHTGGGPAAHAVSAHGTGVMDRQVPPDALRPAVDSSREVGDNPIRPSASRVLLTIWLTGTLAALGAVILSLVRLGRLARTAAVVTDPAWQSAAASIAARLRMRVPVRIVESPDVDAPMAGGCWQPTVFLPGGARDWTTERRDVVLTHELAHLAGRDPLRHALARVAVALYWFHPLVWIAAARSSAAREAACDEAVIATGVRRSTYARILLDLSECATPSPLTNAALPIVQESHLERRLLNILNGHARPAGRRLTFLTTGAIVLLLSVAAAQPRNSGTSGTTGVVGATSAHIQPVANARRVLTPVVELVAASAHASAPLVVTAVPLREVATRVETTPAVAWGPPSEATPASAQGRPQRELDRGLYEAAKHGDIDDVSEMLAAGANVNAPINGDGSALIAAARKGHMEVARLLLDRGANPDLGVNGDGSPLIAAAGRGDIEMARLLLDRGANPNIGIVGDGSPLIAASGRGQLAMMEFLLARGAELELVVRSDENALISACEYGQLASVRWLVQRGADVNARVLVNETYRGAFIEWRTPLVMARRNGHAAIVAFLLSAGARE
jgi:beta-lactamase regulating signal transducer with metallopeptidase domain